MSCTSRWWLLEALDRGDELVVGLGQQLVHARDRLGRADAGDDVLALGVLQELAVQHVLARRGVAREADAGARALAAVAEHHLADVGGRAEVVGDVVRAAVDVRARRAPGAEHGRDREPQLLARILREVVAAALAVEPLELGAEPAQVVAGEVGVELRAALGLAPRERVLEDVRRRRPRRRRRTSAAGGGRSRRRSARRPSPRPAPRRRRRSGRG